MRKVPQTVIDTKVRKYLAELAEHIETLEKHHEQLSKLAKEKKLDGASEKLWDAIRKARNNLDKQWNELTPSLLSIALKSQK